jgi:hypothetical protein
MYIPDLPTYLVFYLETTRGNSIDPPTTTMIMTMDDDTLQIFIYGYSASRHKFVLGVRIRTSYAGDCGLLPQPINVIHGKVRLQMVLWTLGILIFIMIPSSSDDFIIGAAAVGLIN